MPCIVVDEQLLVGRRDPLPSATMSDDASAISVVTKQLAADGKKVLLVAHSYRGVPATQSLEQQKSARGVTSGIQKLAYLSALVPQVGQSTADWVGRLPEYLTVEVDGPTYLAKFVTNVSQDDYMNCDPVTSSKLIFSDLQDEEGLLWTKKIQQHSTLSFREGLSYPGYKDVDIAYIL